MVNSMQYIDSNVNSVEPPFMYTVFFFNLKIIQMQSSEGLYLYQPVKAVPYVI